MSRPNWNYNKYIPIKLLNISSGFCFGCVLKTLFENVYISFVLFVVNIIILKLVNHLEKELI